MEDEFPKVRDEAKKFLAAFKKCKKNPCANLICFDCEPESTLKGIKPLDDDNMEKMMNKLDNVKVTCLDEGCTNLENAMNEAAKEIAKHGKPTTILLLTDGKDKTPKLMKLDIDANGKKCKLCRACKGTPAKADWITPRLMTSGKPRPPQGEEKEYEKDLKGFTTSLNKVLSPGSSGGGGGSGGDGDGDGGGGGGGGGNGSGPPGGKKPDAKPPDKERRPD